MSNPDYVYKEGYGQAIADAIQEINEAFGQVQNELNCTQGPPMSKEDRRALNDKLLALRWVRTLVKTLKSNR